MSQGVICEDCSADQITTKLELYWVAKVTYITEHSYNIWIGAWNYEEVDIYIEDNGSNCYNVIQVRSGQSNQSDKEEQQ